jgi:hypothetical protein
MACQFGCLLLIVEPKGRECRPVILIRSSLENDRNDRHARANQGGRVQTINLRSPTVGGDPYLDVDESSIPVTISTLVVVVRSCQHVLS